RGKDLFGPGDFPLQILDLADQTKRVAKELSVFGIGHLLELQRQSLRGWRGRRPKGSPIREREGLVFPFGRKMRSAAMIVNYHRVEAGFRPRDFLDRRPYRRFPSLIARMSVTAMRQ